MIGFVRPAGHRRRSYRSERAMRCALRFNLILRAVHLHLQRMIGNHLRKTAGVTGLNLEAVHKNRIKGIAVENNGQHRICAAGNRHRLMPKHTCP